MTQGYASTQKITQDVRSSTSNNKSTNLNAATTWTGTGESTLNVAGIQVSLKTDQNCTIYVDQSPDNSNWDLVDSYAYLAGTNFGITVQAISSYFRVRVTNLSSTVNTTYFRLQSVLCPIVETLPRSLDSKGNLKTSVIGLTDSANNALKITSTGDMRIAEPYRMIGTTFGTAIDTTFWTFTKSGTDSVGTQTAGIATLSSGTDNSGYSKIESVRYSRYITNCPNLVKQYIRIDDITIAKNTRRWGAFTLSTVTPQNGCFFELDENGVLSVNVCSNTSITKIESGSFNGTVSEYTVNTNAHTYEIIYRIMGCQFYVDGVLLHTFTPTTAVLYQTPHLPIAATTVNAADGSTSGTIESFGMSLLRLGKSDTSPTYRNINTTAVTAAILKRGPGKLHRVTFNTIPNTTIISIYDALTATNPICVMNPPNGACPFTMEFNCDFYTGLTVTTTPNNADVTFIFE